MYQGLVQLGTGYEERTMSTQNRAVEFSPPYTRQDEEETDRSRRSPVLRPADIAVPGNIPNADGSAALDVKEYGEFAMKAISSRIASLMRDLSPEDVALLLAVGLVLGIFPICGIPTILCILASFVLRVNFPALQIVNQLSWPLHVAMLLPLVRLGSRIIAPSSGHAKTLTVTLATAVLQAAAGWLCICIPLGLLLYFSFLCILRRQGTGKQISSPESEDDATHKGCRTQEPVSFGAPSSPRLFSTDLSESSNFVLGQGR
jgi:uncharacterized protein (DUF2062 family)